MIFDRAAAASRIERRWFVIGIIRSLEACRSSRFGFEGDKALFCFCNQFPENAFNLGRASESEGRP
jgi:hypothetical protein